MAPLFTSHQTHTVQLISPPTFESMLKEVASLSARLSLPRPAASLTILKAARLRRAMKINYTQLLLNLSPWTMLKLNILLFKIGTQEIARDVVASIIL